MNLQTTANGNAFGAVDYDQVCLNYDATRRAGKSNIQLLVELLDPLENSSVLDVGCGTGNHLLNLRALARQVVGLDASAGMLSQAKPKTSDAALVRADAQSIPFSDDAFDCAYCIQALHHIPDKGRTISEVYRILKSGGRFAVESCSHDQLETFCYCYYFPRALEIDRRRIPDIGKIGELFSESRFLDVAIHICPLEDGYRDAPEDYLNERTRDGSSTFSLLARQEIEEGCERIRRDLRSGKAARIEADCRRRAERIGGRVAFVSGRKP